MKKKERKVICLEEKEERNKTQKVAEHSSLVNWSRVMLMTVLIVVQLIYMYRMVIYIDDEMVGVVVLVQLM